MVARPLGALALDDGEGRLRVVPVQLAGGVLRGGRGHDEERRRRLHRLRCMHAACLFIGIGPEAGERGREEEEWLAGSLNCGEEEELVVCGV